jgi:phage terminase large subunit-like protein
VAPVVPRWDNAELRRFDRFSKAFVRQTKGRWSGQPLSLEEWQRETIGELLWRDPETGLRRYREALIGIPRKNGKSTLAAALALYFLVVEGTLRDPGAEVYAAAASKDQAKIVFGQAKAFVEASPRIASLCQVMRDSIIVKETGAVFRVLSSDAPKQHGLNPSCVVIDELHAHENGDLYEALVTADLAREETLVVSITTAGHDFDSVLGEVFMRVFGSKPKVDREACEFVAAADKPDDVYGRWWTVADEDLRNPEAWARANPSSWVTEAMLTARGGDPRVGRKGRTRWSSFERLNLNRWTRAEELWLPVGAWDEIEREGFEIPEGVSVFVGVDIGRKHDTTAIVEVAAEPVETEDGPIRPVRAHVFGAHPDPEKPEPQAHEIIAAEAVPFDRIENRIRKIHEANPVVEVVYDPHFFARSAEILEDEGFEMVEFPQSGDRMTLASQGLYDAVVVDKSIAHDGDVVLRAHVEAAVARDTGRGWRLDKRKSREAMDATVALSLAFERACAGEEHGFSVRFFSEDDLDILEEEANEEGA